ncbi:MAG TPA: hypothetical protein VFB37_10750 [Steroidobacteraceae bacterium]|nr:hypothetical protein [Steroidobacteraceae bacterium]
MSGTGHEDDFEAYLRQRSVLPGRPLSSQRLEPPSDLDDLVLKKARQAIHAREPLPLYRAPRWAVPVALVATVLLTLSILLNVSLTTRRQIPPAVSAQTRSSASTSKPEALQSVAPPSAESAPANGASADAGSPAATYAPSAVTTAPEPAPRANDVAAEAARQSAAAALSAAPEASRRAAAAAKSRADPQTWLRRIESLRKQGRTAEADAELRRFRQVFPGYPLKAPAADARDPAK